MISCISTAGNGSAWSKAVPAPCIGPRATRRRRRVSSRGWTCCAPCLPRTGSSPERSWWRACDDKLRAGMLNTLLVFCVAGLLSAAFTPLAIRVAWATDFLDRPSTPLKTQRTPVAYLGGPAIALAFGAAVLLLKFTLDPSRGFAPWPLGLEKGRGVYAIGLGGSLALGLGLLDDRKALGPGTKFLWQVAGALVLVLCGLRVRFVSEAWLSLGLTVLWVVTVTNALNFVDILDGLAGSVCCAAAVVFWI